MRVTFVLALLAGCQTQYDTVTKKRELDSFTYVDCGVAAPGTRNVCTVPLFSEAAGPVTIYDIRTTDISIPDGGALDDGSFLVAPEDWQSADCEGGDCVTLEGYDDSSDVDTLALPLTFAPQAEGYYQAELTIWSNDNQTEAKEPLPDDPDREEPVWKVQLRGLSRYACGHLVPDFADLGKKTVGGDFPAAVRIENCGIVTLEVTNVVEQGTGAEEMAVTSSLPMYVLPGLSQDVSVLWSVADDSAVEDVFSFTSNSDSLDAETFTVVGNDCEDSADASWDADGDGWTVCGGDCDDADASINPSLTERTGNSVDEDCDGDITDAANPVGSDDDRDGWSESQGDCDDADPDVSPDAPETENDRDDDCDGVIDDGTARVDDDGDGFAERQGDCDDTNRLVYPGAEETPDDVDNDCDDIVDEGSSWFDDDQDGYAEVQDDASTVDCDDRDPWVYVGAFEYCDGYDNDCDHVVDEGEDDAEGGACAFLPARKDEEPVQQQQKGCATGGGDVGAGSAPIGILLAILRLSRQRR